MRVLRGNTDAVSLCRVLGFVTQVWDDLVDEPGKRPAKDINAAFRAALTVPLANPFVQQHATRVSVLMDTAIVDWMAANALEGRDEQGTRLAYVLRDSVVRLVVHCAEIVGGVEWREQVAPEIWRYFCDESYEQYREEHLT